MRTIIVFILLISAVLITGSLLAYPLNLLLSPFIDLEFNKYVHYTILLSGLALCIYYLKSNNEMTAVYSLSLSTHDRQSVFAKGFLVGVLILFIVECLLFVLDMRTLDPRLINGGVFGLLYTILKALLTGLFVGLIEETVYRGAIFSGLQKYANTLIAVICSSLFYAGVHFIEFADVSVDTVINPLDGLAMLANGFFMFKDPLIYDSFITLFILGILFCLARIKTGGIIASIGLHAGVVTMNKVMNYSTDYKSGSEFELLINYYDKLNGWLASTCLLIASLIYFYFPKKSKSSL